MIAASSRDRAACAPVFAALAICASTWAVGGPLDSQTATDGLKEALEVGVDRAVELLGQVDGYLGDPEVRIPVPRELDKVGKTLRKIGLGSDVDEFETSMNRAAEAAAPLAKDVFVDTIKQMNFTDALEIVRGRKHQATDYLRLHAGPELYERFRPIVTEQLEAVGATRAFNSMIEDVSKLPFFREPVFELDDYVTEQALDGMFYVIAKEEEKIRKDPLARTSDLLNTVFGGTKDKTPWWKRLFKD